MTHAPLDIDPTLDRPVTPGAHALPFRCLPTAPRQLNLPSVDEPWRYAWAAAKVALRGWLRPHRLGLAGGAHYHAPVHLSLGLRNRWRAVFDVPAAAIGAVPLATHGSVGRLLLAQLFADLGVKSHRRRHLQHRSEHHADVASCARAHELHLNCLVQRVLRLGAADALVEVQTQVLGHDGTLLARLHDGYLVRGLPAAQLTTLASDAAVLRALLGLRRRLPCLSTTQGGALVSEMPLPPHMAWAYARVSGDLDPARNSRLGAWVCGFRRARLQEMALRDLVVRHLAELGAPLACFELTFVRRAHLGRALQLVLDGRALEVHDAQGRLIAHGSLGAPDAAGAGSAPT